MSQKQVIPWYYRFRLTNWLMAKPWRWHYRTIYRTLRRPQRIAGGDWTGYGRLEAAWRALTFPHVHHESEE